MHKGFVVLESGETFQGVWLGGEPQAGEVVFNTSHSGYEEIATDPSYFSQIVVMTAPMQGNYGCDPSSWESKKIHIEGFVCLEMQNTHRDQSWLQALIEKGVPVLTQVDTRSLVLTLRQKGTPWGALVKAQSSEEALEKANTMIAEKRKCDKDWPYLVSRKTKETLKGESPQGPKIAVLDYGVKNNILRELQKKSSEVCVFPSRTTAQSILDYDPDGIVLSNGPGDPENVEQSVETIQALLGKKPVFGICMGHQLLARALGGKTYALKFGHRGANHPIQDKLLNRIYMSSQNHGYAVEAKSLPEDVEITHINLYDKTVAGLRSTKNTCYSVQFHPENCPGPRDSSELFEHFIESLR